MTRDAVVYTALFGRYEQLNEQPVAASSDLAFVCFTDDPALVSDSWDVRVVAPALPADPVRSARRLKILGPPLEPRPTTTLWIDNSVVLTSPPELLLADWLDDADFAAPLHSFRARVVDEFEAVLHDERDDPGRVNEQLSHYLESCPDVLELAPLWTAMVARRHTPAVEQMDDVWYQHILRYSRRDQLSVRVAMAQAAGLRSRAIPIDNIASHLHRWPVTFDRRQSDRVRNPVDALRPLAARIRLLELTLEDTRQASARAEHALDAVRDQSQGLLAATVVREDQLVRLEARAAQLHERVSHLEAELAMMRTSETWRAGRVVVGALWPVRWLLKRDGQGMASSRPSDGHR